jgi:hypothetical protein
MQQFEVIFFGPFELPSLQSYPDMNQHVPSPFFHGYAKLYLCDDEAQATNIITDTDRSYRVRLNRLDYSKGGHTIYPY